MSIITRIYNHVYDFPVFPQIRCMVRHDENRTEYETLLKDFQAMATYNFFYLKAERNFQWVCQGHLCFKWITTCSTEFRIMHRLPLQRRPTTPNYSLVLAASLLFCSEGNDSASSTRHQMSIAHSSFQQQCKNHVFPIHYCCTNDQVKIHPHIFYFSFAVSNHCWTHSCCVTWTSHLEWTKPVQSILHHSRQLYGSSYWPLGSIWSDCVRQIEKHSPKSLLHSSRSIPQQGGVEVCNAQIVSQHDHKDNESSMSPWIDWTTTSIDDSTRAIGLSKAAGIAKLKWTAKVDKMESAERKLWSVRLLINSLTCACGHFFVLPIAVLPNLQSSRTRNCFKNWMELQIPTPL